MDQFKEVATVINNNQPDWTNIIETAPNVTLDIGTKLYVKEPKSFEEVLTQIADLLQMDMHYFSKRPCATCGTISKLIGKPFGCVLKAANQKNMNKGA